MIMMFCNRSKNYSCDFCKLEYNNSMFFEVVPTQVFRKGSGALTYSCASPLQPGHVVLIPLGKRTVTGIVLRRVSKVDFPTKPIITLLHHTPIPMHLVKAIQWLSNYYLTPLPQTANLIVPSNIAARGAIAQEAKLDFFEKNTKSQKKSTKKQPQKPTPAQKASTAVIKIPLISLNPSQQKAIDEIEAATSYTKLLHGITGSGKTNIYLELAARTLRRGQSVILLVPEIALTSQLVKIFQSTFGDMVTLIHSNQTLAERRKTWLEILESGAPNEDDTILNEIQDSCKKSTPNRGDANHHSSAPNRGDAIFSEVQGSSEQRTEAYLKYGEGVVAGDNAEIRKKSTPNGEFDTVDGHNSSTPNRGDANMDELQGKLESRKETYSVVRRLSNGEFDTVDRHSSAPKVIVGPRSALLVPEHNLGLIIIDEAHENTYYQENNPKYSALRLASFIASTLKITCLQGTATPNIVDYHLAKKHNSLIELSEKAKTTAIDPHITLVDLKNRAHFCKNRYFSDQLLDNISENLQAKQQTLIFHNRRGSAPITLCEECGWQALCPNCYLPLTLHEDGYLLTCHTCEHQAKVPSSCPECHAAGVVHKGFGTKLLENELKRLFPKANVARFDADNAKTETLNALYDEVKSGKVDILIGTQTLAKGLDLPHLATVGVVQADSGLSLPDFATEERTFELLTQVIGRVGRGHLDTANVIVQTYQPDNPVIKTAIAVDYQAFAKYLLKNRKRQQLPPFTYLAKITVAYKTEATTVKKISEIHRLLQQNPQLTVSPPSPAFHERTARGFIWQLFAKSSSRNTLLHAMHTLEKYNCSISLDPPSLL